MPFTAPHDQGFVFCILKIRIAIAILTGILHSWGIIGEVLANRYISTAVILSVGSLAFLPINRLFGDLGRLLLDERSSNNIDPTFADCLKRAKTEGRASE